MGCQGVRLTVFDFFRGSRIQISKQHQTKRHSKICHILSLASSAHQECIGATAGQHAREAHICNLGNAAAVVEEHIAGLAVKPDDVHGVQIC